MKSTGRGYMDSLDQLDRLQEAGFRQLLNYSRGIRKTKPNVFNSGDFFKATLEIPFDFGGNASSLAKSSIRDVLPRLNVPNLSDLDVEWEDLLRLANKGFPIIWTIPSDILEMALASQESTISITDDQRMKIRALTKQVWAETVELYPRMDSELRLLVSFVIRLNDYKEGGLGVPLAVNVLERLVSDFCDELGYFQQNARSAEIRDRARRLEDSGRLGPLRTSVERSCAALVGATITGIFSNEAAYPREGGRGLTWPVENGLRRNSVAHYIRPQYLTSDNMAIAAAAVVGVVRQLLQKQAQRRVWH